MPYSVGMMHQDAEKLENLEGHVMPEKMEELWTERMPVTAGLFKEHGRVSP